MRLEEACSCGATFAVDADAGDALGAAVGWRSTHRHETWVAEVEGAEEEL